MTDYFLLDPAYKDFPDGQKLKFLTVYGEQHTFIVLAIIIPFVLTLTIFMIVQLAITEWGYLIMGVSTQALITETCQKSKGTYTYTFDAVNFWGDVEHFVAQEDASRTNPCPKLGASIDVTYIEGHPKFSRPSNAHPLWVSIVMAIFSVVMPLKYYVWMRELLENIWAFIKSFPKYSRLKRAETLVDGMVTGTGIAPKPDIATRRDGYYIQVECEFVIGSTIYKTKQVKRRTDLLKKPLPKIGTPVRVLYADDDAYVML